MEERIFGFDRRCGSPRTRRFLLCTSVCVRLASQNVIGWLPRRFQSLFLFVFSTAPSNLFKRIKFAFLSCRTTTHVFLNLPLCGLRKRSSCSRLVQRHHAHTIMPDMPCIMHHVQHCSAPLAMHAVRRVVLFSAFLGGALPSRNIDVHTRLSLVSVGSDKF
jgi:hypothetical protein